MNREAMIAAIEEWREPWDVLVVGGGATGAGVAVDAASRGYKTLLVEQDDFGKGTSSRSTKLVHGGVRYLQQGNISLVIEALKERGIMKQLAPHLVHEQRFVVPNYVWWEAPFYGLGMKMYDVLAFRYGFGPSKILSAAETLEHIPTLRTDGLRGGVQYYDGQFDDSRLLVNLVQTAVEQGATAVNYVRVDRLVKDASGFVSGAMMTDMESGRELTVAARCVINATGPWVDALRLQDDPQAGSIIAPSQGVHIVLDRRFLPGDTAIMVPHTRDGRVMFAIPWHDHAVVGTTDTPVAKADLEPVPMEEEIDFILETAAGYLTQPATRGDVLSAFAGIRPLVRAGDSQSTSALSRDHHIEISGSGMVTICGGKWTTYRHMAEDCVNQAATVADLPERPCVTRTLNVHGFQHHSDQHGARAVYGSDAPHLAALEKDAPELASTLNDALPYTGGEVAWACRAEMARTLEDVLSRRTRALLLNARAAVASAPAAAAVMARELGRDAEWQREQVEKFTALAANYTVTDRNG